MFHYPRPQVSKKILQRSGLFFVGTEFPSSVHTLSPLMVNRDLLNHPRTVRTGQVA